MLIEVGFGLVGMIGYWKVTTPDPGKPGKEWEISARTLARWTMVAAFALQPIQGLLERHRSLQGASIFVLSGIIGMVGMFAIFIYASQLALRIPDRGLARQISVVMWGIVGTSLAALVGGVILVIGLAGAVKGSGGHKAMSGPAGLEAGLGLGCVVGISYLVFSLWAIHLIYRFRKVLREAAFQAVTTWARSPEPSRGSSIPPEETAMR